MSTRKMQRVEIEWDDASLVRGWADPGSRRTETPIRCFTTGYLLSRDKRAVRVVMSRGEGENVAECLVIPRETVRRIRRLR